MSDDPRTTILNAPMSRLQILAVAITVGLNALDGFDVVSISFAAPGIALEWGVERGALGIVLSMGLIGMGLGSLLVAPLADVVGRRPLMLGCLAAMTAGMFLSATADGIYILSLWRILTGLGIGGMLASINAVAAEFSSQKRRDLSVSIMSVGYPVGVVVGGLIAAWLLNHFDWRAVFIFGGVFSALFIPLILIFLPESISFLVQKRPNGALEKINGIIGRMGHAPIAAMPPMPAVADRGRPSDIFRPGLAFTTFVLSVSYFLHIMTFYYMQSWIPKIVVDMGFSQAQGSSVLVWANLGGAIGGIAIGALTIRFGLKRLTTLVTFGTAAVVSMFGFVAPNLTSLTIIVFIAGFFWNSAVVGFYALAARNFPTHARATGTGFMIGFGRAGAALAPIIAGFLFQAGLGRDVVSPVMAAGSLLGAILLLIGLRHAASKEA
ncbi:MAG: transporter [Sphingomonas bacterium]|nr:MFS transporter [Sphingomonas bacterium]MDB5688993.1 transporter [Sphingomonas bacterium]